MLRTAGLVVAVAVIAGVAGVLATLAFQGGDDDPEPDRIVGIFQRCTIVGENGRSLDFEGDDCVDLEPTSSTPFVVTSNRVELTIRTDEGTTYTVNVDPVMPVSIGDSWPP